MRASSSSRDAPKPARRIRCAIRAISSWFAIFCFFLSRVPFFLKSIAFACRFEPRVSACPAETQSTPRPKARWTNGSQVIMQPTIAAILDQAPHTRNSTFRPARHRAYGVLFRTNYSGDLVRRRDKQLIPARHESALAMSLKPATSRSFSFLNGWLSRERCRTAGYPSRAGDGNRRNKRMHADNLT